MKKLSKTDETETDLPKIFESLDDSKDAVAVEVFEDDEGIPLSTDPEWSDYLMSKLVGDELDDKGNPKVVGLRRLANLVLGDIVENVTRTLQSPHPENNSTAVVECMLRIRFEDNDIRTFTDVADGSPSNCNSVFSKFPTAMASSRSEGRALRKALNIRIVCAEEVDDETQRTEPIKLATEQQKNFIKNRSQENGIDVDKLLKHENLKELNDLSYLQAAKLNQKVNNYQKNRKSIPEEIKVV